VVGDFRTKEILPVIEASFGKIKKGTAPDQKKAIDPPQTGERRVQVNRVAELPYLVMAYHVPNISHPDSYALDVIETLLSSGKSSRLYTNLVEQQIALSADADNSLLSRDRTYPYIPFHGRLCPRAQGTADRPEDCSGQHHHWQCGAKT
jgi:zinc protease